MAIRKPSNEIGRGNQDPTTSVHIPGIGISAIIGITDSAAIATDAEIVLTFPQPGGGTITIGIGAFSNPGTSDIEVLNGARTGIGSAQNMASAINSSSFGLTATDRAVTGGAVVDITNDSGGIAGVVTRAVTGTGTVTSFTINSQTVGVNPSSIEEPVFNFNGPFTNIIPENDPIQGLALIANDIDRALETLSGLGASEELAAVTALSLASSSSSLNSRMRVAFPTPGSITRISSATASGSITAILPSSDTTYNIPVNYDIEGKRVSEIIVIATDASATLPEFVNAFKAAWDSNGQLFNQDFRVSVDTTTGVITFTPVASGSKYNTRISLDIEVPVTTIDPFDTIRGVNLIGGVDASSTVNVPGLPSSVGSEQEGRISLLGSRRPSSGLLGRDGKTISNIFINDISDYSIRQVILRVLDSLMDIFIIISDDPATIVTGPASVEGSLANLVTVIRREFSIEFGEIMRAFGRNAEADSRTKIAYDNTIVNNSADQGLLVYADQVYDILNSARLATTFAALKIAIDSVGTNKLLLKN